jgi:hypothetical protein
MELEGFGVSLIGRSVWLHGTDEVPWEFLQSTHHAMKVLIRGTIQPCLAEAETDWTCIWHPTQTRDWSCIATILRSVGVGSCIIALDHVDVPPTFWSFLDSLQREGRTVITRLWMNETPPPLVPDATFLGPTADATAAQRMLEVFSALPTRAGHGPWQATADNWLSVVQAAHEQGMGLVVTDLEEHAWTLLWHKPADSRPVLERRIPTAQHWLRIGMKCLG